MHTGFGWGNLREGDHFEGLGLDRRIILKSMFKKWDLGMGMDSWRAVVNAVMNLRVP
jgi:hypothetical protein